MLSKELKEVVLDGLVAGLQNILNHPELEEKLTNAFATASTTSKYNKTSTNISIKLQLGSNKNNSSQLTHTKIMLQLQIPKIGLIIDNEKGKITDVSQSISEILLLGGKAMIAKVKLLVE